MYAKELTFNKANITSDSCQFLDLDIPFQCSFKNITIKETISLLDGDVPLVPSYDIYVSQLVKFACICNNVSDFNDNRKLLQQEYRFDILLKTFTKITAI